MITELTSSMKTVCMGRFIMRIPKDMTTSGYVTLYYGLGKDFDTIDVDIESDSATPASLRRQMDAEAKEIDQQNKNKVTNRSMLLNYEVINDHMIYLRKQDDRLTSAASNHELHVLIGITQLSLQADSYEGIPDAGIYDPDGKVETPEQIRAQLLKLATEIHTYDDPEKAGPGFGLGNVVINSNNDEEDASLQLGMDAYPDLLLEIYSKALTPEGSYPTLLNRVHSGIGTLAVSLLREGNVMFAGMKGQELMVTTHDEHGKRLLNFGAESIRSNPGFTRPLISLYLSAGGAISGDGGPDGKGGSRYVDSSLSPREATALWDAMLSSLRVRPNAVSTSRPK